ncbi:MAG: nitrate- and nitrite sensing domain-containing protein [Candidatus Competibacteraceae bacterium]|nr:nitrate- and nitrite sensing domain-containing protein [Candidatus Competibacteraceae bacterium]
MNILNRFKIWQKLALLITALGVPIALLAYLLVAEKNVAIDFASQEMRGVEYLKPVRQLLQNIAEHRGLSSGYLNGDTAFREKITAKQNQLAKHIEVMDTIDARYGDMLKAKSSWQALKSDWQQLGAGVFNLTAADSFARHTALIKKLLDLTVQVGITSNLVLDPDPDSYYLMDVVVNRVPFLNEHLGQLRALGTGFVTRRQQLSEDDHVRLAKLMGQIQMMQVDIQNSLERAFESNNSLKSLLESQGTGLTQPVNAFLAVLEQLARGEQVASTLSGADVFAAGTRAIEAGFSLYDATVPVLMELLDKRVTVLNGKNSPF